MKTTIKNILNKNNRSLTFYFCLSCKKLYKIGKFESPHNLSHGYCEPCGIVKLSEIKKEIKERKEKENAI